MSIITTVFDDSRVLSKIAKWTESPANTIDKADKFQKLLKDVGLRPFAMGTNRQVYTHKDYPKVVFKISLDDQGVLDNLNEYQKSDLSDKFPASFDIDTEGYVLVQRRWKEIPYSEFNRKETQKEIRKMLKSLTDDFALIDCGLDKHKNFGISPDGHYGLLDFGYVELAELANFNCPHVSPSNKDRNKMKYCKGKLHYTKSFDKMKCDECENIFDPNVIVNGYTLNRWDMHDEKNRKKFERYAPSDELKQFYASFNKTRDRSSLTKYVEISNKSKTVQVEGEDTNMENKNDFLSRVRRLTGNEPGQKTIASITVPMEPPVVQHVPTEHVSDREPRRLTYYESKPNGIDVLKRNTDVDTDCDPNNEDETYDVSPDPVVHDPRIKFAVEDNIVDFKFQDAVQKLTELGVDHDETDKIISQLFFDRFPEVKEVLDEVKNKVEKKIDEDDAETENYTRNIKDANIQILKPVSYPDQLHIAFSVDELNADPWIVMSKDDMIVHINLKAHMEQLAQIDTEGDTELVVTRMEMQSVTDFDDDYENSYFGSEAEED